MQKPSQTAKAKIEGVCQRLNRPVEVIGVVGAPQVIRFALLPQNRVLSSGRPGQLTQIKHLRSLHADIALGLQIDVVNIVYDNKHLWLEVPRQQRQTVTWGEFVNTLHLWGNKLPVPLGVSVMGEPLVLDLNDSATPHLLVAGTTQSGKTNLLSSIVATVAIHRPDVQMTILDTKGQLARFRGVANVCTEANNCLNHLQVVYSEANARYEGTRPRTPWLIVIDEFADLALQEKGVDTVMAQIAQKVAAANIHVILATQRPSTDVVTGLIKANFPARVALSVVSHTDSQVVLDQPGAERLLGYGDGLLMLHKGLVRFQAPYITDRDIAAVC